MEGAKLYLSSLSRVVESLLKTHESEIFMVDCSYINESDGCDVEKLLNHKFAMNMSIRDLANANFTSEITILQTMHLFYIWFGSVVHLDSRVEGSREQVFYPITNGYKTVMKMFGKKAFVDAEPLVSKMTKLEERNKELSDKLEAIRGAIN